MGLPLSGSSLFIDTNIEPPWIQIFTTSEKSVWISDFSACQINRIRSSPATRSYPSRSEDLGH